MATKSSRTGFDGEKDPGLKDVDRLKGLMPNLKIVVMPKVNRMTVPTDPAFI